VANPSDKVQASTAAAIEPEQSASPNIEIARQTATKVLNSLAGINTSIFLAAPTRCGKTHTLHKWLGDLTTRFPQADIYVISQKYEDFPGVASDRLTVFDR
jgi:chromosomal replication initiation ATPase DnaA